MSYEQNCNDYALYGNPERDAMEYEENARYDRYDGMREEFYDEEPDCEEPYSDHLQAYYLAAERVARYVDIDTAEDIVYCPF